MNDEQRRMALFQVQPEGPALFFARQRYHSFMQTRLHSEHSALQDKK